MKIKFLTLYFLLTLVVCSAQTFNQISVSEAKEDINKLISTIESVHFNPYRLISKEILLNKKDSIISTWANDSISYREFTKTGMLISSFLSNGHTSFDWQNPMIFPELTTNKFLPFKATIINDKFVITSTLNKLLKSGDIVLSINDMDALSLFKECMQLTGGIKSFKTVVTEKLFPLYLFFLMDSEEGYNLKLSSGEEIYIPGIGIQELFNFIQSEINKPNYTFEIMEDSVGIISYNSCNDYEAFNIFLDTTFQKISTASIDKLIIDLRFNSGGDSGLNDILLSYLTKKKYRQSSGRYWKVSKEVKNKIKKDSLWSNFLDNSFLNAYVIAKDQSIINSVDTSFRINSIPDYYFDGRHCFLIGPYTFSSANYLADAIKTFNLSTLIGMPTGELTNDFGEQVEFQLPNSKSYFFVPTTYDIGADANENKVSQVFPDFVSKENVINTAINILKQNN